MDRARSADRWMTVGEAARTLGMSRTTLLAAEEAGVLVPMRTPGGHRRYSTAELDRYLHRSGAEPLAPPGPAPSPPAPATAGVIAAARAALRPVAQAMAADSAGLYLRDRGGLRFTAAFGIPRWLVERLGADPAPPPVVAAAETGRPQLFDAATTAYPEPRSTGHGLAVALPHGDGALFLVRPIGRELLPGELRVVDAFGELLASVVADQRRIAALEQRLARIAALSDLDGRA